MHTLPPGAPADLNEAFAYIGTITNPSIDDMKLMVILEAAGKALYDDMAAGVEDENVRALLVRNGREELAHAHRVSRAVEKLTSAEYPVPAPEENPYLTGPSTKREVNKAILTALAEVEFGGENLYEQWAANCTNPEAAALFRQNGLEETEHGSRLQQAAKLLTA